MTLRRMLPVAAACAALFGASFIAGNEILDAEDSPSARPAGSAPPAESRPPVGRPQLALALGRAAGLPNLRTPPRRPKRQRERYPAPVAASTAPVSAERPVSEPQPVAPVPETEPVTTPPPAPPSSPPAPPAPTQSSPPGSSAPGPDAAPSTPQPNPDPAPSGGTGYEADEE